MDSVTAVDTLAEVDPGFVQLCKTLLGDAVDPVEAWEFLYAPAPVVKMSPDSAAVHVNRAIGKIPHVGAHLQSRKGKLVATTMVGAPAAGVVVGRKDGSSEPKVRSRSLMKSDDTEVVFKGEFSKVDDDKRQVFGWASIVEVDGQPVIDRQGDIITADEIEKAAYEYVHKSRKGGHQHKRTEDDQPFHASDMIESIVFTPEKIAKMGLPEDFPVGWWVGYKVHDDETWAKVKKGEVTGFSIHGRGRRVEVPA